MAEHEPSRLELELELLDAMYPDQAIYTPKAREIKFTQDGAVLQIRLPETYPDSGLPDVIAASSASKDDVRAATKSAIKELGLAEGEEALDAIIAAFQQTLEVIHTEQLHPPNTHSGTAGVDATAKTVIIWLHHLLALTKRKLALSPTTLSGITKPGYPGIMIFSGPAPAVNEHVITLKAENWQAFQVRYEEETLWGFAHGQGVKEVETMAEVVKSLQVDDATKMELTQSEKQKQEFLNAVGIK
jgi:hypothetical protein